MEFLKLLSANEIVAQTISFLLLLALLRAFLWKPVLKLLDDRKAATASGLKEIEDMRSETLRLKSEYESRLDAIEETARVLTRETIAEADRLANEIRQNAEMDARLIIEKSSDTIRAEILKAKKDLRDEIVDLVIKATEKTIQEKLTETSDKKIIEGFINEMERGKQPA